MDKKHLGGPPLQSDDSKETDFSELDTKQTAHYPGLSGKVVFITGGGSGIGASIVKAFAEQGCRVAFVSLHEPEALDLVETIANLGYEKPLFMQCDIRDIASLQEAIDRTAKELGAIDVLINNAARDNRHTLKETSVEDWDDGQSTNLRPHFFSAQAAARYMETIGRGSIINVGSNSALLGLSGYPGYVAAKAGIMGLTKALARELGPDKIRVNTIIPGWVMTKKQKQMWVTPEALKECLDHQCIKRTIEPFEVAHLALYLASDAAAMITGQSLVIDGGRT